MKRRIEKLENRYMMAGDWHNATLGCDVDGSGLVTPRDVLVLISSINSTGSRLLVGQRTDSDLYMLDVSNDGKLQPRDALIVIGLLNQFSGPLEAIAGLNSQSDPNKNGVVLKENVTFAGTTLPGADIEIQGLSAAKNPNAKVKADSQGHFEIPVVVSPGMNVLCVVASDPRGYKIQIDQPTRFGDVAQDWNAAILNVVREFRTITSDPVPGTVITSPPPRVARNLAMIHSAMFDAMNAVEGTFESYMQSIPSNANASSIAAGVTAAYRVASSIYPAAKEMETWDATLQETMAVVAAGSAKEAGVTLGTQVGNAMIELRRNDGSSSTVVYSPGSNPGDWNRTSPDFLPAALPQWLNVTPFAMTAGNQFRAATPPTLNSPEYAAAVDEVMKLGAKDSATRTALQKNIAIFWADGGGTFTPPGHWNQIASNVSSIKGTTPLQTARTFALLNLALADAGISSWDSKYYFDLWRPIDAIRKADTDGNSATQKDVDWEPFLQTPPFPTYTSGHSTFSGAASKVLAGLFGDVTPFSTQSDLHTAPGKQSFEDVGILTRSFDTFSQAAEEAGMSRIYGGIHFAFDNTEGLKAGRSIGQLVMDNYLKPA